MRICSILALLLFAVACGDDTQQPADSDVGSADVANTSDTNDMNDDMNDDMSPSSETPRPELDVVIVDRIVEFIDGDGGPVVFEVPDDAVSVMVSIVGEARRNYTLSGWRNGDGSDLVPFDWFDTEPPSLALPGIARVCLTCPNRIVAISGAFTAIAPNNDSVSIVPGEHTIRPFGYQSAGFVVTPLNGETATVRVVIKRLPAEPTSGVLDLNLYFTGAQGWTAATAPTDDTVQQMLTEIEEIYSQANIRLGVITYTDVPAEYAVIESVLFGSKIYDLFALSAGRPRDAINVFLVDELFGGSGPDEMNVLLGIAGGIPGSIVGGTLQAGVAINTTGHPAFDVPTSRVIAHEVGHYLGLFHTTEQGGALHDPIVDTAPDEPMQLMYWSAGDTLISPTQAAVMRRNVWVNHPEAR